VSNNIIDIGWASSADQLSPIQKFERDSIITDKIFVSVREELHSSTNKSMKFLGAYSVGFCAALLFGGNSVLIGLGAVGCSYMVFRHVSDKKRRASLMRDCKAQAGSMYCGTRKQAIIEYIEKALK